MLDDEAGHKVKRITVRVGQRLSYQRHGHRSEHWFVVAGTGTVLLNGDEHLVGPGVAIDVPRGTAHRIHNSGDEDLVFVEVQHGDYFGEDDIVRLGRGDGEQVIMYGCEQDDGLAGNCGCAVLPWLPA